LGTDDPELNARTIAIYRERYAKLGLFESSVYPGISSGLSALSAAHFRLFVVTSKPEVFAKRIIDHFELGPHFERVYGSELTGERSDKGELIQHVLANEGLSDSKTWMIGDRMHDIRGAKQNRLRSAGVLWGYGSRAELTEAGADALFSEMPELVRAFTA
jgi:phosphoglycolate phosphatase